MCILMSGYNFSIAVRRLACISVAFALFYVSTSLRLVFFHAKLQQLGLFIFITLVPFTFFLAFALDIGTFCELYSLGSYLIYYFLG